MENDSNTNDAKPNGPACAEPLTAAQAAFARGVQLGSFVRRYPAAAVAGRVERIVEVLGAYYVAHGFSKVCVCNCWEKTLSAIHPGEVWIVSAPGEDLRVVGVMRGQNDRRMRWRPMEAFSARLSAVAGPATVCL